VTPLLAICVVVATAAQVVVAVVGLRVLSRFNRLTLEVERSAQVFRDSAERAKSASREIQEFVASLHEVVPPVRRAAEAFGQVGERVADLGTVVLNEVEGPVRRTIDLFHGVQAGAGYFLNRLAHNGHGAKKGGKSDERARTHE
jgi:hypothetical protein